MTRHRRHTSGRQRRGSRRRGWGLGTHDQEPQQDCQFANYERLGVGIRLVLILREKKTRKAESQIAKAAGDQPHAQDARQKVRLLGASRAELRLTFEVDLNECNRELRQQPHRPLGTEE